MSIKMPPFAKPVAKAPAKPAAQPTFAGHTPAAKQAEAPKHAPVQQAKPHAVGHKFDRKA